MATGFTNKHWRHYMRILISSLIVLAIVPASGNAQAAPKGVIPVSVTQLAPESRMQAAKGPTIESAAIGIRPAVSNTDAAASQRARRRAVGHNVTLMIVGGAAMVAGAIIGGDAGTIFLIGGAVIGLWGLYNYLQ
jgi:hypothetical protein